MMSPWKTEQPNVSHHREQLNASHHLREQLNVSLHLREPTDYPFPVVITSVTSCVLSIIGAAIIFLTFVAFREIRNFTRKLMICLTVADFISASGFLVSAVRYEVMQEHILHSDDHSAGLLCVVQSVLTTYSSLVSFFLTVIVSWHIFLTVLLQTDRTGTTGFLIGFNIVSWTVPGAIVAAALVQGALGDDENQMVGTGPWCWVRSEAPDSILWMVLAGKGWEIACYLLTISAYVLLKLNLFMRHRRERFSTIHTSLRDEDQNFLYVWLVLVAIRIWGTIRFFIFTLHGHTYSTHTLVTVFLYLQAFGDPSQAFFNCIIFCVLDATIRNRMRELIRTACCRRGRLSESTRGEERRLLGSERTVNRELGRVPSTVGNNKRRNESSSAMGNNKCRNESSSAMGNNKRRNESSSAMGNGEHRRNEMYGTVGNDERRRNEWPSAIGNIEDRNNELVNSDSMEWSYNSQMAASENVTDVGNVQYARRTIDKHGTSYSELYSMTE